MLISFTLENYRSFKERHMVICQPDEKIKMHKENILQTKNADILKVISIFGHNASGKSNIIKALNVLKKLLSYDNDLKELLKQVYEPFLYDDVMKNKPTYFEIELLINNKLVRYSIEFNNKEILSEKLIEINQNNEESIILQSSEIEFYYDVYNCKYVDEIGKSSKNNKLNIDMLDKIKQDFISSLVSNSDFKFKTLLTLKDKIALPIKEWFLNKLIILHNSNEFIELLMLPSHKQYGELFLSDKQNSDTNKTIKNKILDFVSGADLAIKYIFSKKEENVRGNKSYHFFSQHTVFKQDGTYDTMPMSFFETESTGTQRLFMLSKEIINVISNGGILVIDELDKNLHPLLLFYVVQYFNSSLTNPKGSQLLFTTHNSELLDFGDLRADQILFVSKNRKEFSSIYPLFKYKINHDVSLSNLYLFGSFGAIPKLPTGFNIGEK
ncbi:AAA family ATPase [Mucispirillum schaedleri]|uniref:AAA family ATPase n=1 Tax=Mucispirillum schaedleri TaxID=248039 RepID=UPI001F562264|nr:ATP-binding protein [Mucispirillum schaedleri]